MIDKLKAYYQYIKVVVPEINSQLIKPYDFNESLHIAKSRLRHRNLTPGKELNFIMAVPINNWEIQLIEHAKLFGDTHHIDFDSRGFFQSKESWQSWRDQNFSHLKFEVTSNYDKNKINILFLYLTEFHIDPIRLKELRYNNVIIIGFNWDDRLHFSSKHKGQVVGVKGLAKNTDFNLTMSFSSLSRYAQNGFSVFYWEGEESSYVKDFVLPKKKFNKVLFCGSKYGYRESIIEYLTKKNLPIDVYGKGWGSDYVSSKDLAYKIPRYLLNLGVSTIGYTKKLTCVKLRDIEIPLLGGLYITNRGAEIERIYSENKNILMYGNEEECYRKSSEVLNNPDKFSEVQRNGFLKASQFSWENRFKYLIKLVNQFIIGDNYEKRQKDSN